MAAGAVSSDRDPRHDTRWNWLLLGLCTIGLGTVAASARSAIALYGAHAHERDIDPDETRGLVDLCAAAATVSAA